MARTGAPLSPHHSFHVSSRCINREHFNIPTEQVWEIMCEYLWFVRHAYNFRIHAFTLMDNHYHLIASAPDNNFSEAMNYFLRETSRQIGYEANRINQTYGGRYYRCQLTSHHYFLNAYKYLYRNPIEAGLVGRVEKYKYSTLHGLLGSSKLIIPIEEDPTLFSNIEGTVEWLNRSPNEQHREAMRKALKRRVFTLAKNRRTSKSHELEFILY